jgi:hypothetical protein
VKLELKTLLEERDDLRKGSDVVVLQHKRQLEVRDKEENKLTFYTLLL